jgi:hypothetical protein
MENAAIDRRGISFGLRERKLVYCSGPLRFRLCG